MNKVSIVIPVFNEEQSIIQTLTELQEIMSSSYEYELIVVDDGSTDSTQSRIQEALPEVTIIDNVLNMGYGYSLKRGIEKAKHDTIVILDGDGSYPVENLPEMIAIYEKGLDLVVGSRNNFFIEDSFSKSIFRWILKLIVEFTAGVKIPDVNSGLRVFSKNTILPYFPYLSNKFSFTTSMTLHYSLDSMKVLFSPNGYRKRTGKSKVKIFKDSIRTLQFIVEIIAIKNPLKLHLMIMAPTFIFILSTLVYGIYNQVFYPLVLATSVIFIQISIAVLNLSLSKK